MRRFIPSCVLVVGTFMLFCSISASPAMAGMRTTMNRTLPEVNFNGVGLVDAIDFLRDVSGANIAVNWKALEEAGIAKDAPVNVRLRQVSMRKAMETILSEVGGGDKLAYDTEENVIEITTTELANAKMYTRVYPVQDLIMDIPDFTDAPDLSLNTTSNNQNQNPLGNGGIGAGGGGGAGGGAAASPFEGAGKGDNNKGMTKEERANALIDLIKNVIQPEIWADNGGKAAIRMWNGNLIITAPRSVQEAIGGSFD